MFHKQYMGMELEVEPGQPGSESIPVIIHLCNEMGPSRSAFQGKNHCELLFCCHWAEIPFKHVGFRLPLVAHGTHVLPEAT